MKLTKNTQDTFDPNEQIVQTKIKARGYERPAGGAEHLNDSRGLKNDLPRFQHDPPGFQNDPMSLKTLPRPRPLTCYPSPSEPII